MRFAKLICSITVGALMLCCIDSLAQVAPPPPPRPVLEMPRDIPLANIIVVSGKAVLQAQPDAVTFNAYITTEAPTVGDAFSRNVDAHAKVIAALKAHGVKASEITTRGMSLDSVERDQIKVGYSVRVSIIISVPATKKVGDLIQVALDSGANGIDGPRYHLLNQKQYEGQLIEMAYKDAHDKAQSIATLAGRRLGRLVAATDGSSSPFELSTTPYFVGEAEGGIEYEGRPQAILFGVTLAFLLED